MNEQFFIKLCIPIPKPLDPAIRAILPEIVRDYVEYVIYDKEWCEVAHAIYKNR